MADRRVALVTGASFGIGFATAALFASRGYRTFGTTRQLGVRTPPKGVEMLKLDVRSDDDFLAGHLEGSGHIPLPELHARRASLQLAAQTVLGSAKLLIESGQHPGMLKDGVTSPGGTAIAGLHTLEAGGLRNVLMNAVEAATRRSRELGEEFLRKL